MRKEIDRADFVLMVCTRQYLNVYLHQTPPSQRRGGRWECSIIKGYLYNRKPGSNHKFRPILFESSDEKVSHAELRTAPQFLVSADVGYEDLCRLLLNQPRVKARPVGMARLFKSPFSQAPVPLDAPAPLEAPAPPVLLVDPLPVGFSDRMNPLFSDFAHFGLAARIWKSDINILLPGLVAFLLGAATWTLGQLASANCVELILSINGVESPKPRPVGYAWELNHGLWFLIGFPLALVLGFIGVSVANRLLVGLALKDRWDV